VFWLALALPDASAPVVSPAARASGPVEPAACPARSGRILLAEDNATNRVVAAMLLRKAGYAVDDVANGQEAVDAVRRHDYDILLIDMQMPILDGLAATRAIRGLANGKAAVPIIAITANAMAGDREACLRAGMNDYIAKPFDPPLLLATVGRWLGDARAPGEAEFCAAAPRASDGPDIDSAHLDALAAVVGDATLARLLRDYLSGESARIAEIETLAARGDLPGLARVAHDLTSVAGNFGARRLERLARRLERACLADRHADIGALVGEMRRVSGIAYRDIAARVPDPRN
jgi:CheY-like chemotaxis protein/HPt (histidine-containing phosphotransfer) domain-containing protein